MKVRPRGRVAAAARPPAGPPPAATAPRRRSRRTGRLAGRRGAVTAELALALPGVVVLSIAVVWLVVAASAQLRCADAAREGARALAREEPVARAVSLARAVAPADAEVDVRTAGGLVRVRVAAVTAAPGPLGRLLRVTVRGEAVAAVEDTR